MNNLTSLYCKKLPYWETGKYEITILVDNAMASEQIYEHLTGFDITYKSMKVDYDNRGRLWHSVEANFQTEVARDNFIIFIYESFIKKYIFLPGYDSGYREFQDKISDRLS